MNKACQQNRDHPFLKLKTGLNSIKEDYAYAINELEFNNYQAFSFAYNENYQNLNSGDIVIKFIAYACTKYRCSY